MSVPNYATNYAENSGSCDFANNIELNLICKSVINSDLVLRWADERVIKGVPYSVWRSSDSNQNVILVSFYASKIVNSNVITVDPDRFQILGKNNNNNVKDFSKVHFTHSDMHCLNFSLRYFNELLHSCRNEPIDLDEVAMDHGILQYTEKKLPRLAASRSNSPIPILSLLVVIAVYLKSI
ncbi:uncharacterized protein LOC6563484 [Drosophila grimshawi]|uniref:GH18135 n=1 Tax=Drosophila grimshawi TaxID=7222 RepID=B4JGL3_DROGR|nr:uncharacterized protein LOC6563484 [Drosophila grimshawi]EDV93710.1 GH18135 [Drosophila grimshawi]